MKIYPTMLERLYQHVKAHELTINDLVHRLADEGQELGYLRAELEELLDQERYANNK